MRIITRQSKLALLQVEEVMRQYPDVHYELMKTDSYGDKHKEVSLMDQSVSPDFFTRELDAALIEGRADIAIHSAKDLPYPLPVGIEVIALTESADKSDSLVTRDGKTLRQLPARSKIGTSSEQRKAELMALRPDVEVVAIRGTIEERIAQVDDYTLDGLIVATCALDRLGLAHRASERLPFKTHPLQGNLAVTASVDVSAEIRELFSKIDVRTRYGKVTLVGFGPGDPELITMKGAKALEHAGIIFYDDLTNESFVQQFKAEKVYVGKRSGKHSHSQAYINDLIYAAAIKGLNVVRLKGGDPMVFAHGREEVDYLKSKMVKVEVIPGVSSGIALASLTQIPLTHRGLARSVAFVLGHSSEPQTPHADTLVYYMGGDNISLIANKLIESGKSVDTPVALVSNVSLPTQRKVFSTLGELRYARYRDTPVLVLVGEVVRLEQSSHRSCTYYTGTQGSTPLIRIEKNEVEQPEATDFDWVVFTSRYGVRFYEKSLKDVKVASVGPVTSHELGILGVHPDFESPTESAEGLIDFFRKQPHARILLLRSDKGLKALSEGLKKAGHAVTDLPVYRNMPEPSPAIQDLLNYDKVVFTSPSTVEAFKAIYQREDSRHLLLVAKGKTTYEAIQTI
ncbi:MAG: uroporphyrinogen-III C-methyltransferase [Bacteroidaceae bacterium]|nr:uroporphyrinogen-III C-methyltransferase [Bacteroidaceae bacterium]